MSKIFAEEYIVQEYIVQEYIVSSTLHQTFNVKVNSLFSKVK